MKIKGLQTLKNMTEQELNDNFGKYVVASIVTLIAVGVVFDLSSFMIQVIILIMAFIIAIMIWSLNLLIIRRHKIEGVVVQ